MSKKEKEINEEEKAPQQESPETPEKEAEEPKTKEQELEEELENTKDRLLRTAAEYANYRARSAKEKEQTFTNAKGTVIAELLPAIDNLERAIATENADYEALKKGVEMTLEGVMASLEKLGVEQFGESGDAFDPNLHNAVMHIEDEQYGENTVAEVFQKGYRVGDRVIRAAMVKTAN